MDTNGGKPLSPWKVPSRISLKRIRHKINSDLSLQSLSSSANDRTGPKANAKRNRPMINKFALARSISTPTSDENVVTPALTESTSEKSLEKQDENLLAKLHRVMPPPDLVANDLQFQSTMKSFAFEETFTPADSSKTQSTSLSLSFDPNSPFRQSPGRNSPRLSHGLVVEILMSLSHRTPIGFLDQLHETSFDRRISRSGIRLFLSSGGQRQSSLSLSHLVLDVSSPRLAQTLPPYSTAAIGQHELRLTRRTSSTGVARRMEERLSIAIPSLPHASYRILLHVHTHIQHSLP